MKKPVILGALGLVLVVMLARAFLMGPPAPPPAPPGGAAAAGQGTAPAGAAEQPAEAVPAKPAPAPGKAAPVDVDKLLASVQQVEFVYDRSLLPRNPMSPLLGRAAVLSAAGESVAQGAATPSQAEAEMLAQRLSVTGIVYDKRNPVAVVNDDVVAPGDVLPEGALVQAIEPDHVVVKVGTSMVSLPLKRLEEQ